jgi:hypothetical protein
MQRVEKRCDKILNERNVSELVIFYGQTVPNVCGRARYNLDYVTY